MPHNQTMAVMTSSAKDDWETPEDLFQQLHKEFNFTLDAAASESNHRVSQYFSKEKSGLDKAWSGRVFLNPPYGRKETGIWIRKAFSQKDNCEVIVILIPARTDTKWFHDCIYNQSNVEIRFIKGRLFFRGATNPSPFPSMLVIMRPTDNYDYL